MRKRIPPLLLLLTFLSYSVSAKTLIFVDQNDQKLADVVVTIPAMSTRSKSPAGSAVMDQLDKQFVPHVLLIQKGQQVAFPNSDNIRHHVYSFSEPKAFEIKLYSGDTVAPVKFDKTGVVVLGCNIHDSMVGYIYVYDNEWAVRSEASGRLSVPDSASQVQVWHPHLAVVKSQTQVFELNDSEDVQTIMLTLQARPKKNKRTNTFGKRTFGS